jgi:hypothetical protein
LHDVMHERSLFSERVLRGPCHVWSCTSSDFL